MTAHEALGAIELARRIATGELDRSDVVAVALERIESTGARLNAFTEARPHAVGEAKGATGRFAGVPVAVKDMFVDRGRIPTVGSRVGAHWLSGTATILDRLRGAGAVVVAYSNLHEWAIGTTSAVTATGPIRNPWDPERSAGGSSGGSAAALAAGVVALAVGTDAGGSIRIPSACCGVVGLKPTWGLVPLAGFANGELGPPINHIGPMARSVADARSLLEVLSGASIGAVDVSALRVGVARSDLFDDVDPGVTSALESCLGLLRHEVTSVGGVEIAGAEQAASTLPVLLLSHTAELVADDLRDRPDAFQPATLELLKLGAQITDDDRARAEMEWVGMRAAWDDLFAKVDVVVTPTLSAPPPRLDHLAVELPSGTSSAELSYLALNAPMNLGGIPALSLPCGETSEGWTVNVTLSAARGRDDLVLALGERIEDVTEHRFVNRVAPSPS